MHDSKEHVGLFLKSLGIKQVNVICFLALVIIIKTYNINMCSIPSRHSMLLVLGKTNNGSHSSYFAEIVQASMLKKCQPPDSSRKTCHGKQEKTVETKTKEGCYDSRIGSAIKDGKHFYHLLSAK